MTQIARRWRVVVSGAAAGVVGVVAFAGGPAAADPAFPTPPLPAPATVTVTVTPAAAPIPGHPAATPAAPAPLAPALAPAAPAPAVVPAAPATPAVPTPVSQPIVPASSGTLKDFFAEHHVALEPQNSRDFTALAIVLPMPRGWTQVPDPNVPDAFAVIADRVGGDGLYPSNAQVVVYKLIGDFDPKEAISHGFIDSQQLPAWRSTDGSMADVGGVPTSVIEGTFRDNAMTLNTSRRNLIATTGADRYLVSLAVTTSVDQVVAAAEATEAIAKGFKVSAPMAGSPAPAVAPAPPPAPAPLAPTSTPTPAVPAPQMLGLPR